MKKSSRIIQLAIGVIVLLLLPTVVNARAGSVRVFYYGLGDKYLGRRHAASWWKQTPEGWREVVDLVHYGIATTDRSTPFGTELCLEIVSFPAWADGEYDERIGTIVCGTVVDRMPRWVEHRFGPSIDVWPALAEALMGPDFERVGTIRVRVTPAEGKQSDIRQWRKEQWYTLIASSFH